MTDLTDSEKLKETVNVCRGNAEKLLDHWEEMQGPADRYLPPLYWIMNAMTHQLDFILELVGGVPMRSEAEYVEVVEAKDQAYRERDCLVALVSKHYPSHLCRHPDEDTSWEDDWRWIVCVHLPAGQVTWHIHDSELSMFEHLSQEAGHWDGHSTDEKWKRVHSVLPLRHLNRTEPSDEVQEDRAASVPDR